MADKIIIEVYKTKAPEEFTKLLGDKDSRIEVGSAAASSAASAAALLKRAAALSAEKLGDNERVDYILRNSETLRAYMVHLIDEDVKSRGPLRKAMKDGDARKIEASIQTACCIGAEIINMMAQCMELANELGAICPEDALPYVGESAELALGAVRACMIYVVSMGDKSADETYRYVTHRENEITLEHCMDIYNEITARIKSAV